MYKLRRKFWLETLWLGTPMICLIVIDEDSDSLHTNR